MSGQVSGGQADGGRIEEVRRGLRRCVDPSSSPQSEH